MEKKIVKKVSAGKLLYMKDVLDEIGAKPDDHVVFTISGQTARIEKVKL